MYEKSPEKEAQTYFRKRGIATKRNRGLCNRFKEAHGRTKVVASRSCAVCQMNKDTYMRQRCLEEGIPYAKDVAARAYVAERARHRKQLFEARQIRRSTSAKSGSTGIPADLSDLLS